MMPRTASVRLFRLALHAWLVLYILFAVPAVEWIWERPISPELTGPPGPFRFLTHAFSSWLPGEFALPTVGLLLLLAVRGLVLPTRWWSAMLTWAAYTSLMNHAWLVGTGGHQLIANALFWNMLLPQGEVPVARGNAVGPFTATIGITAFWVLRFQLLVAYAVSALQKLTGEQWVHGHAVGIVASDPAYGPAFLIGHDTISMLLTYATLGFQLLFPLVVWWRPTRIIWMWIGVLFHFSSGLCFGILDMGLAFLSLYPLWFAEDAAVKWSKSLSAGFGLYHLRIQDRPRAAP